MSRDSNRSDNSFNEFYQHIKKLHKRVSHKPGNHYFDFIIRRCKWTKIRPMIKARHILLKLQYDAVANPYKIITVRSGRINKYLSEPILNNPPTRGDNSHLWGKIKSGDWDKKNTNPISKFPYYQGFKQHFNSNIPWKETIAIDHHVNKTIKKYGLPYGKYETESELRDYLSEKYKIYDKIYNDMRENGFRLIKRDTLFDPRKYHAIDGIHIGREGGLIFSGEGKHRLAIAKLLEIEKVPVRVGIRHKQWQEIRDNIFNNGLHDNYSKSIQYHPDLQDIIVTYL